MLATPGRHDLVGLISSDSGALGEAFGRVVKDVDDRDTELRHQGSGRLLADALDVMLQVLLDAPDGIGNDSYRLLGFERWPVLRIVNHLAVELEQIIRIPVGE